MIDWTKPVQTRDGRPVRILCTDGPSPTHPVVAIIDNCYVNTLPLHGCVSTQVHEETAADLVNVPEETVRWVNVYEKYIGSRLYESIEEAGCPGVLCGRTGLLKLTYRDGNLVNAEPQEI